MVALIVPVVILVFIKTYRVHRKRDDALKRDLMETPEDELTGVFGSSDYRVARTRDEIERDVNRGRVGRELFPALILLVAVVLGLEHMVANRFYRE